MIVADHCGSSGSGVLAASSRTKENAGVDRRSGSVVAVERLADEVGEQSSEHRADSVLIAERGDEVERVGYR